MEHWRRHLPRRYRALEDPQAFFTGLGAQAAAHYEQIRDSLLEGVNPNDGTIGWAEFRTGWPRPTRPPGRWSRPN